MSATMTEDVEALKGLALRSPVSVTYPLPPRNYLPLATGDLKIRRRRRRSCQPDAVLCYVCHVRRVVHSSIADSSLDAPKLTSFF